jgi:hypothetical protein
VVAEDRGVVEERKMTPIRIAELLERLAIYADGGFHWGDGKKARALAAALRKNAEPGGNLCLKCRWTFGRTVPSVDCGCGGVIVPLYSILDVEVEP